MLSTTAKAFVQLHIAILLAGFTGILGKLISLGEGMLVWYRMSIAFVVLGIYVFFSKSLEKISFKEMCKIAFTGVLICVHWLFFYASIKLSNVSIGVVCFSLVGFFTALFEPYFMRTRFSVREFFYSILTVAGVCFIFSFDARYRAGIIAGIIGALLAALYAISIRRLCQGYNTNTTLFYQMGGGALFLSLLLPFYLSFFEITHIIPTFRDLIMLLVLGILCTLGMSYLYIQSLQYITAFTANLSYNLEPVYSIFIAIVFLGEARELNFSFYIGMLCIIASVALQSLWVLQHKQSSCLN